MRERYVSSMCLLMGGVLVCTGLLAVEVQVNGAEFQPGVQVASRRCGDGRGARARGAGFVAERSMCNSRLRLRPRSIPRIHKM